MNISDAAKKSELPVKTIRYYADIGLVKETGRTATGYRTYDETAVKRLIFVRRSREFGFSISQTEELLALYSDEKRSIEKHSPTHYGCKRSLLGNFLSLNQAS